MTTTLDILRETGVECAEVEAYTNCDGGGAACDACLLYGKPGQGESCADAAIDALVELVVQKDWMFKEALIILSLYGLDGVLFTEIARYKARHEF
jgi:hypothetical protein